MATIHIESREDQIADKVLLPGDPLRAKYIAEKFLTDYELVNDVRNMFAYTGYYKGHRITVMGSGMGCASAGIYAFELFKFYNVQKMIRIGTSGSMKPRVRVMDTILSTGSYSQSSFAYHWGETTDHFIETSTPLNEVILETSKELGINLKFGPTITSDTFDVYEDIDHILEACPFRDDLCCSEMEGFALCHLARKLGRQFSMLVTVVDSKFTPDVHITSEQREQSLDNMITLALEAIIK